jgi:hypothetical protein
MQRCSLGVISDSWLDARLTDAATEKDDGRLHGLVRGVLRLCTTSVDASSELHSEELSARCVVDEVSVVALKLDTPSLGRRGVWRRLRSMGGGGRLRRGERLKAALEDEAETPR